MDLKDVVSDFAEAFRTADAARPQAAASRTGRVYAPGLGPHGEVAAMVLILDQLIRMRPDCYADSGPADYPGTRQRCDLVVGRPPIWAVEIKMARAFGDNAKLDDTYLKDLLSPYPQDHSALGDAVKLASSGFTCRKAVLVYGFEYKARPLLPALEALELLMRNLVDVGHAEVAAFTDLVHPVHSSGAVYAWEVRGRTVNPRSER